MIKAVGDWMLDVLGVPFGGPQNGKDKHGEFFSPRTELYLDKFTPLVLYYHGFTPDGKPQGEPEIIGKVEKVTRAADGVWYRVALDKTKEYARRVWEAAQKGMARASSGTVAHLARIARDGEILNWAVTELSLFDVDESRQPANDYAVAIAAAKTFYAKAGVNLPAEFIEGDITGSGIGEQQPEADEAKKLEGQAQGDLKMSDEKKTPEVDIEAIVAKAVSAALKTADDARAAEAKAKAEQEAAVKAQVEAAVKEERAKWAKVGRLPDGGEAPKFHKSARKYDNLETRDLAFLIDVLTPNKHQSEEKDYARANPEAMKALAMRLESEDVRRGTSDVQGVKVANEQLYRDAVEAFKATGMKANELDHTTQSGFGSDWVGTAYAQNLWEAIRQDVSIGAKLMAGAIEIPQGFSSVHLPLEGADPTWYKVAETTGTNSTTGLPDSTVTASKVATANKQLTVAKMGARVIWSGEMEEDSLIPFIANLRRQVEVSGLEQFTHAVIDGDTETGATTNINHIGGTPGATDLYLLFNGFRKSPLVTTTALSRSAGGSLVAEDFLKTAKLMGNAGVNALDVSKVSFIIDPNTHWKALTLPEVKSRDVFAQPTIESGKLSGIYGYPVIVSAFMHYKSSVRKANTAGKVDQTTTANNTTGSILAVRWDQWLLGYKRRITVETQRIPAADATQIVALMRLGLVQRDTNAAAISYNVGLS